MFLPNHNVARAAGEHLVPVPEQGACDIGTLCATLLDVLDIAIVVFDGRGELVFSNQIAQRVLCEGASIRLVQGRLCGTPEDSAALVAMARACADADASAAPSWFRVARVDRAPLVVSFTRIRPERAGSVAPLAVGVIQDPEARSTLRPGEIAERYGLTPAEARVAAEVADGKVAKVIARDLNIGPATVRSHLRSIYLKLGVANAKELIALLRGSVFHRAFDAGTLPGEDNGAH